MLAISTICGSTLLLIMLWLFKILTSFNLSTHLSHPEGGGGVIRIVGGGVPHGLPPSAAALGEAAEVTRQWRSARKADGADVLRVRRLCPDSVSAGGGASSEYAVTNGKLLVA